MQAERRSTAAGRRPGSGQLEKETPAAYRSVGRGAAQLGGRTGGRGKCITLLVRASISVMDELSSKQAMKRKRQEDGGKEQKKVDCYDSVQSPSHEQ